MKIKPYTIEDYPTLAEWYIRRKTFLLPAEFLPPLGFVVMDGETPRAAAWLYYSTKIAWLAWLCTNPDNTPRQSYRAVHMIDEFAKIEVAAQGNYLLVAESSSHGVTNLHKQHGFRSDGQKDLMLKFIFCQEKGGK